MYCTITEVRNSINLEAEEPDDDIITDFIERADAEIDLWNSGDAANHTDSIEYSLNRSVYKLNHDFKKVRAVRIAINTLDEFNENNIIANAYVESASNGEDVDWWTDEAGTGDTLAWSQDYSFTMDRSLKITKAAAVNSYWESDGQSVKTTAEFRASARIKVDANTTGKAYLKLVFEDTAGTAIKTFTSEAVSQEITQPSSASVIACVSDSTSDTTQVMTVEGTANGINTVETVELTGTDSVSTANSFSYIRGIRKSSDSAGTVTATSNSGAVTNATFTAKQSEKSDWIKAEVEGSASPEGYVAKLQFYVSSSATTGSAYADSFTLKQRNFKPLYATREIKLYETYTDNVQFEVDYTRSERSKLVRQLSKDLASFYIIGLHFGIETSCKSYDDMRMRFYGGKLASPKLVVIFLRIEDNKTQLLKYDNICTDYVMGESP